MTHKRHWCDYRMIDFILARHANVGLSYRDACKVVISRLARQWETFRSLDRWERRQFIRAVAYYHWRHQLSYAQVIHGPL